MVGVDTAPLAQADPRISRRSASEELRRDEELLQKQQPEGSLARRWYLAGSAALVLGSAQRAQGSALIDMERCGTAGVEELRRRAGGGLVLLDDGMLCLAVALPRGHPRWSEDVTDSYRWLGEALARGLHQLGVRSARRVEVSEAREESARLAADTSPAAALVRAGCFGGLSPHEIVVGNAKLVGMAQVRRRNGALFQVGILLRDQRPLADLVRTPDEATREALRELLGRRTVGLTSVLQELPPVGRIARVLDTSLGS